MLTERPAAPDDGSPDARLSAALAAAEAGPAGRTQVLAAFAGARVFLALTARASGCTSSAATGRIHKSETQMSLLSIGSASGERAMVVFADGHQVQRWHRQARPVPVLGRQAANTALQDGAAALLLDPTGAAFVLGRSELTELAAGRLPIPGTALSTRLGQAPVQALDDPALVVALGRALAGEAHLRQARLLVGPEGPVLGVVPRAGLDAAQLAALASRVMAALRPDLPAAGLDVAVVEPAGPGTPIPFTRRASVRRRRR